MKPFYLFLVIPILAARATDDPLERLTPAQACNEALARNPGIREALAQWYAARERVTQEGAWDDLQVSAVSRLARFVSVPRNGFADQTVSISQMIPISGKNLWRARAAAEEALATYEDARRRELDVAAQTRAAYYKLANARAQMELNRENLVLLKQIAEVSRVRYEAGNQGAADVLAADTEAGKLLDSAKDLERETVAEQTRLNVLMGRDAFAPVGELEDAKPVWSDPPVGRLRTLMLENRPEIQAAQQRLDAARARLELAHRAWIPDPSLTIEGQRYNSAGQGISELDAGVSINIPWTNPHKYSAATREAADAVAAAQAALDESRLEAIGLLRMKLEDVAAAEHHTHLAAGPLLKQAREGLKASEVGYQAGKVSLADWLAAEERVHDLEAMKQEEASNMAAAIAELEAVVGAPINDKGDQ